MNNFRWLTGVPAGDDGASPAPLTVPAQRVFSEEARGQTRALLGAGA